MSKQIAVVKYFVNFRPYRVGSESILPPALELTREQYQIIKQAVASNKFVEIGGSLYNTGDIMRIEQVIDKPKRLWRHDFDSELKYIDYLTNNGYSEY